MSFQSLGFWNRENKLLTRVSRPRDSPLLVQQGQAQRRTGTRAGGCLVWAVCSSDLKAPVTASNCVLPVVCESPFIPLWIDELFTCTMSIPPLLCRDTQSHLDGIWLACLPGERKVWWAWHAGTEEDRVSQDMPGRAAKCMWARVAQMDARSPGPRPLPPPGNAVCQVLGEALFLWPARWDSAPDPAAAAAVGLGLSLTHFFCHICFLSSTS